MVYDKEYYKKYREKNKQSLAKKNKLWRKNNPDKVKRAHQKQKKSGYTKKYLAQYRRTANCKYSSLLSRAKRRNIHFIMVKKNFINWFRKELKLCHYCGKEVTMGIMGIRKSWLTIDRKDNNLPYAIGNIVISCYKCNLIKADDISYETMVLIGKIIKAER